MEGKNTEQLKEKFSDVGALAASHIRTANPSHRCTCVRTPFPSTAPAPNSFTAALISNWKVWPLAQAVNFSLMPLQYRVPYVRPPLN
jgi:hypothetical protein